MVIWAIMNWYRQACLGERGYEMNEIPLEPVHTALSHAMKMSEAIEEPYRSLAFPILLRYFLEHSIVKPGTKQAVHSQSLTGVAINEFLGKLKTGSFLDLSVALAYYLRRREGREYFTIRDIADAFVRARADRPRNLSDVLAGSAKNGWIAEMEERRDGLKSWYLTASGEKHVEGNLWREE
jgi:hypothetical protein